MTVFYLVFFSNCLLISVVEALFLLFNMILSKSIVVILYLFDFSGPRMESVDLTLCAIFQKRELIIQTAG